MAANRLSLYFILLLTVGWIFLNIDRSALRETQDPKTTLAQMPPPAEVQELRRTRNQLHRALSLLEKCFGRRIDMDRIQSTPVTITAYSSTEAQCDPSPYITASLDPVRVGTLAVSPDLLDEMGLSFGQRVLIPGFGVFEVKDTMNPRWHRRVDIWESDTEAARRFGKKEGTLIWMPEKISRPKIASSSLE